MRKGSTLYFRTPDMHILSAEQFFSIIMIGLAPNLVFAVSDSI